MKKCPQCGGEYDASMSFCLDDGADLLYGPATSEDKTRTFGADSDEPQTAILSVPPAAASGSGASEAQTWPQISLTDQTEILPNSVDRPIPVQASRKNSLIAGVLGIILVSALGIGSYFMYGRGSTKLKSKLSGAEEATVTKTSSVNPEAYQAYLKGRYYWNRRTAENLKKAI